MEYFGFIDVLRTVYSEHFTLCLPCVTGWRNSNALYRRRRLRSIGQNYTTRCRQDCSIAYVWSIFDLFFWSQLYKASLGLNSLKDQPVSIGHRISVRWDRDSVALARVWVTRLCVTRRLVASWSYTVRNAYRRLLSHGTFHARFFRLLGYELECVS